MITAETEGAESFAKSVEANKLVILDKITSIATTLGATKVTAKALEWTEKHSITPKVVTDNDALESAKQFATDHRMLVEPACGAALSIVYKYPEMLKNYQSVCVIVCGGANINSLLSTP